MKTKLWYGKYMLQSFLVNPSLVNKPVHSYSSQFQVCKLYTSRHKIIQIFLVLLTSLLYFSSHITLQYTENNLEVTDGCSGEYDKQICPTTPINNI